MEIKEIFLKDLKVDNYRSLKDSSVEFQMGLNIIIGKNGAGKSNLLDFITRYAGRGIFNFPSRQIISNFTMSVQYDSKNVQNVLSCSVEKIRREESKNDKQSLYTYQFTLEKQENNKSIFKNKVIPLTNSRPIRQIDDKSVLEEINILGVLRRVYIKYELPENDLWVSKPNRLTINQDVSFEAFYSGFSFFNQFEFELEFTIEGNETLQEESKKDSNTLKDFLLDYFEKYLNRVSINHFLDNYTPISEIRLNPNLNIYSNEETIIVENLSIDFLIEGDWMPWSYLSDGTKRLFYLISECISVPQGIILVEEPELGIHPHQLLKVLSFLKDQSRNKQIIISTHSPLSLDVLEETELSRIIIATYEKGTKFRHLESSEINKAKKYMNQVGDLSYYWLHSDLEK